jgi:choline dehydrogenase
MGSENDPMAVVNNKGQVNGIDKLRVVDSSIFPTITNGNLNGPTIMVAEKMADTILGNKPLEVNNANVWVEPNWKNSQRTGSPERSVNNY